MNDELLIYHILRGRKQLMKEERMRHDRLMKGYLGEQEVATFIKEEKFSHMLPLYDFLFEVDGRECQIDCLLLTSGRIHHFEVKSATGDYYIKEEKFFLNGGEREIDNPFLQLNRARLLLERFLQQHQINIPTQGHVLFVNEKFSLYEAPRTLPMLLPGQWRQYLQRIEQNAAPLNEHTKKLARFLHSKRKIKSDHAHRPRYKIEELKPGVFCDTCTRKLQRTGRMYFSCMSCKKKQHIDQIILYATAAFHFLFPEVPITAKNIFDWIDGQVGQEKIRLLLKKHLHLHLNGRYSCYKFKNKEKMLVFLQKQVLNDIRFN